MATEFAVGSKAPAFKLPRDGGGAVSLADFKRRKLVIYFYPKADTSGCTREAIDFSRLRADFRKAGVDILGVSADPVAAQDRFKKKHDLGIALLSDETHEMLEGYGVWGKKSMYGRTFMGITRGHLPDRRGRADRPHLAEGQGRRPCGRGAGGGEGARGLRAPIPGISESARGGLGMVAGRRPRRALRCPQVISGKLTATGSNWRELAPA
jgi:peroxiredoxin